MGEQAISWVLVADRHHGLSEGVRGLLETAFGTVVMVADEVSLFEAASRLRLNALVVDSLWLSMAAWTGYERSGSAASGSRRSSSTFSRTRGESVPRGWRRVTDHA